MQRKRKTAPPDAPPPDAPAGTDPAAIRRGFRAVATATGTPAPDDGLTLPTVDPRAPLGTVARQVGMILHAAPIFRTPAGIVTADDAGALEPMTPERFCSWVEDHLAFMRWGKDGPEQESIGKDLAGKLLAADRLRVHVRELRGVHPVRLPAWRGEGEARTVELAPAGYDPATATLGLDLVPFPDDLPLEDCFCFLLETLSRFPWDREGGANFAKCRAFSAWLAAALGAFCVRLFPEGTTRPLVIVNGNQPGAGKSLLARMALAPVYGAIPEGRKSETEAELEKLLDSAALARKPFLLLDDVPNLRSPALNGFITSPAHECRRMHSQALMTAPKVTQLFATGNGLQVTEDLERRAVIIDLFEAGKAMSRRFPAGKEITNEWLALPDTRARFLAALWAFVRHWRDCGMPPAPGRKPSFERWAGVVGGIIGAADEDFADPFGPRTAVTGGDESTRALERVLAVLVGAMEGNEPAPGTDEILAAAEREGLLETITGFVKDPRKALGWRLKRIRGRHFQDTRGRRFEFGKRDLAAGAVYPITFLSPPAGAGT